jgi:hypothetical protein
MPMAYVTNDQALFTRSKTDLAPCSEPSFSFAKYMIVPEQPSLQHWRLLVPRFIKVMPERIYLIKPFL